MADLRTVAPAFVEMAHEIVWASVATVGSDGRPRSRVLHPYWEFDGNNLVGWIATGPDVFGNDLVAIGEVLLPDVGATGLVLARAVEVAEGELEKPEAVDTTVEGGLFVGVDGEAGDEGDVGFTACPMGTHSFLKVSQ